MHLISDPRNPCTESNCESMSDGLQTTWHNYRRTTDKVTTEWPFTSSQNYISACNIPSYLIHFVLQQFIILHNKKKLPVSTSSSSEYEGELKLGFHENSTISKIVWLFVVIRHNQRYFSNMYTWRHIDVQADWRRNWTYGQAPNAIENT